MKSACLVMCVIFAQFAYFQRNDLEEFNTQIWPIWIALYGVVSALSLLSFFVGLPRRLYVSFCLSSLAAAFIRMSDLTPGVMPFFNPNNPAGNEAGGLMVIAIWFGMLAWKHPVFKKEQP